MPLTPDDVRKAAALLDRREAVKRAQDRATVADGRTLTLDSKQFGGLALALAFTQAEELLGAEYASLNARLRALGVEPGP